MHPTGLEPTLVVGEVPAVAVVQPAAHGSAVGQASVQVVIVAVPSDVNGSRQVFHRQIILQRRTELGHGHEVGLVLAVAEGLTVGDVKQAAFVSRLGNGETSGAVAGRRNVEIVTDALGASSFILRLLFVIPAVEGVGVIPRGGPAHHVGFANDPERYRATSSAAPRRWP